ncbi:MAG: hemolysin family protein [Flavobacteriales bacterium]
MELLMIILLVLLNGVFSMSEMALVSSKRFKLEKASKRGNKKAKKALELSEHPTRFLSTVQIGITLIGILLGVYSGENLTNDVVSLLELSSFLKPYSHKLATGIIVVLITYFSIVLGELVPKRIGMVFPEKIITNMAGPMQFLSKLTGPFVWLLTATNNLFIRILGLKDTTEQAVSEEEIKSILKESAQGGEIQDIEQSIVERVFELGDRKVKSLMTHRSEVVFFREEETWQEIRQKIDEEKHSAYPVSTSNDLDDITGIILLKDLFGGHTEQDFKVVNYLREPIYFNENSSAYHVLEAFKKEGNHYGIVVDEYGSVEGIVTMDDMLDALVGEATEQYQNEYKIIQRDDNSWLVDGQYSVFDFEKYFDISVTNEDDQFSTVAGLFIAQLNEIPEVGASLVIDQLKLEVIDKDGPRIDKLLVTIEEEK